MTYYLIELYCNPTGRYEGFVDGQRKESPLFWWRLKCRRNGKVLATSEMYTTKRKAFDAAHRLHGVLTDGEACDFRDLTEDK